MTLTERLLKCFIDTSCSKLIAEQAKIALQIIEKTGPEYLTSFLKV